MAALALGGLNIRAEQVFSNLCELSSHEVRSENVRIVL